MVPGSALRGRSGRGVSGDGVGGGKYSKGFEGLLRPAAASEPIGSDGAKVCFASILQNPDEAVERRSF